MSQRFKHIIGPLLGIILLLIAIYVLYHKLSSFTLGDIERDLRQTSLKSILIATLLTTLYYTVITLYDTIGMRFIGHPLPYRRIALAAFTGYAFGHNVGLSVISSGSVRYRIYSSFGLTVKQSAKVIAFCSLSFWIGFLTVSSVIFLVLPMKIPHILHLPFHTVRILGVIAAGMLLAYGIYTTHAHHGHKIGSLELPKLTPKIFGLQMLVGSLDWLLASSVVYVLLPHADIISFPRLFEIFVLAQICGIASQVPGGIGVFEGVLLVFLPKHVVPVSVVIGALLIYRIIFYMLPLGIATVLIAAHEVRITRKKISERQ